MLRWGEYASDPSYFSFAVCLWFLMRTAPHAHAPTPAHNPQCAHACAMSICKHKHRTMITQTPASNKHPQAKTGSAAGKIRAAAAICRSLLAAWWVRAGGVLIINLGAGSWLSAKTTSTNAQRTTHSCAPSMDIGVWFDLSALTVS
jgi:hypothetical protein